MKEEDDYISKYCPGSCTEVTGRVLRSNGQPLANVQLSATWQDGGGTFKGGGGTRRKKAVAYTDAQGNYTLRFLVRDNEINWGYFKIVPQETICSQVNCPSFTLFWEDTFKRDTTITHDFVVD